VVLFIALAELLDQAGQLSWWTPVILVSLSLSTLGVGARTNPFRFERRYTTPSMLWLLGALLVAVTAIGYCRSSRRVRVGSTVAGVATLLAIVVAVSGVPGVRWYHLGGIHVRDDAKVTAEALALRSATLPGAVVATVWAGAPAYYSDRTMIDLLGKSDRHIANRPPQRVGGETVDFFPGHNKWDYTYSIRDRKPDVVYQLWRGSSRSNLRAWGYEPKCLVNGKLVWVLRTSQLIDRSKLLICN
jgi:hypothetical protein